MMSAVLSNMRKKQCNLVQDELMSTVASAVIEIILTLPSDSLDMRPKKEDTMSSGGARVDSSSLTHRFA